MVYVRKKRKTQKKRTYRKKTKFSRKKSVFKSQNLLTVGFPKTTVVKLRYVDGFTLDPSIATLAYYTFRANSVFDPNRTGTGHQPMNFDLWTQLYNHYIVIGSKITCTFNYQLTAQAGGWIYGVILADDSTSTSDPTTMMEQGLVKYRIRDGHVNTAGTSAPTVKRGYSCKKFFNIANVSDNVERLGAAVGTNPTEEACFNVFAGPTPGSGTDIGTVYCTVSIDYIVMFSEPREQVQS